MNLIGYSLSEIVALFGGTIAGDPATRIKQIGTLSHATDQQIAFLANSKYRQQLETTAAAAVILAEKDADATAMPRIICANPYSYFAKLSAFLNPLPAFRAGIHASATLGEGTQIDPSAHIGAHVSIGAKVQIGAGCVIMPGCSIGDETVIGANTRLYPRVVIYQQCVLGEDNIVHSGAVIGADGFGIAMEAGAWLKIPQIGRVVIGNHVEIGANTTIDRGALDDTVIGDGVKMDNQIQIAHNVKIGAHTAIAGCVGIAGSSSIGQYCRIGGSAGILGHLTIADGVEISSFTLIGKSINKSGTYSGIYPFSEKEDWLKNGVHLRHLDEIVKRIKKLEIELADLKGK